MWKRQGGEQKRNDHFCAETAYSLICFPDGHPRVKKKPLAANAKLKKKRQSKSQNSLISTEMFLRTSENIHACFSALGVCVCCKENVIAGAPTPTTKAQMLLCGESHSKQLLM